MLSRCVLLASFTGAYAPCVQPTQNGCETMSTQKEKVRIDCSETAGHNKWSSCLRLVNINLSNSRAGENGRAIMTASPPLFDAVA